MTTHEIIIRVESDIDPSHLLDIALEMSDNLSGEIESYGHASIVDPDYVSVQDKFKARE